MGYAAIIGIVLILVTVAVVFFFWDRTRPTEVRNDLICRNSVEFVSLNKGLLTDLDCETRFICISGGGKCENLYSTETYKIDLGKEPEEVYNQIYEVLSDLHESCWWQYGEGDKDYIPFWNSLDLSALVKQKKYLCGVCSVVGFDKTIQERVPNIYRAKDSFNSSHKSRKTLYDYMINKATVGDQPSFTYLYYLQNVENYKLVYTTKLRQVNEDIYDSMPTSEQYSIVTGATKGVDTKDIFSALSQPVTLFWGAWKVISNVFERPVFFPPYMTNAVDSRKNTNCANFDLSHV